MATNIQLEMCEAPAACLRAIISTPLTTPCSYECGDELSPPDPADATPVTSNGGTTRMHGIWARVLHK